MLSSFLVRILVLLTFAVIVIRYGVLKTVQNSLSGESLCKASSKVCEVTKIVYDAF